MLKSLGQLDYLFNETMLGLRRGGWMNWAAVSTVTVLLFLFGMSVQASWQVDNLLGQFGNQLEVSVYLDTGVSAKTLQSVVTQIPGVVNVVPVPKEEAWAELVKDLGISDIRGATQQLNGNPLVDELRVKAAESDAVPTIADRLRQTKGVAHVQYMNAAVQQMADLQTGMARISLMVTGVLTITAIAVITTTIRLIVVARRHEIKIMQLVGATRQWIYLPFILQGITFGIVGAAFAWGLLGTIDYLLGKTLAQQPEFIQFLAKGITFSRGETVVFPIVLLGFGTMVGFLGSLFAVHRLAR